MSATSSSRHVVAFGAGVLFALGLGISGMTSPAKVLGFLDLAGAWDPSLMFVMGGAVAVHFVLRRIIVRRLAPLWDTKFHVPTRRDIDAPLLVGAATFGVGWGLAGICPGPGLALAGAALVGLGSGSSSNLAGVVFLVGMTIGILASFRVRGSRDLASREPS